jgi:adenylate kinase family enzyme
MKYIQLLFLLCFIIFSLESAQVVMLMGPSCAGKSTLSKKVCARLIEEDENWIVIDFDDVGEDIVRLIETANHYLQQEINVIIDTNTYEDAMEEEFENAGDIAKIIVTAPLKVLLARNEKRTKRLQRDEKRAFWCKHFVIESFKRSLAWSYDLIIDSSVYSFQEANDLVLNFLKNKKRIYPFL